MASRMSDEHVINLRRTKRIGALIDDAIRQTKSIPKYPQTTFDTVCAEQFRQWQSLVPSLEDSTEELVTNTEIHHEQGQTRLGQVKVEMPSLFQTMDHTSGECFRCLGRPSNRNYKANIATNKVMGRMFIDAHKGLVKKSEQLGNDVRKLPVLLDWLSGQVRDLQSLNSEWIKDLTSKQREFPVDQVAGHLDLVITDGMLRLQKLSNEFHWELKARYHLHQDDVKAYIGKIPLVTAHWKVNFFEKCQNEEDERVNRLVSSVKDLLGQIYKLPGQGGHVVNPVFRSLKTLEAVASLNCPKLTAPVPLDLSINTIVATSAKHGDYESLLLKFRDPKNKEDELFTALKEWLAHLTENSTEFIREKMDKSVEKTKHRIQLFDNEMVAFRELSDRMS